MADLYVHIAVLSLLVAVALLLLGVHIASIARDTDAWVIVRGVARGRYDRFRRALGVRRD